MGKTSEYVLVVFAASAIALGAWLKFSVGPIPYTMQNFGVVLASLLLDPRKATASVALYLAMVAVGMPLTAGPAFGPYALLSYTAGYLWGFLVSAPLISLLVRGYLRARDTCLDRLDRRDVAVLVLLATVGMFPTYLLGYLVFRYYALSTPQLLSWATTAAEFARFHGGGELAVFAASVLLFLPQDVLMDHTLAVVVAGRVCSYLEFRGVLAGGCCSS